MPASNLHAVIDSICKVLFEPEQRRIQNWIDNISKRNREFYPSVKFDAFIYEGDVYRPSWLEKGIPTTRALHSSLWEEMELLVRSGSEIKLDEAFIRQTLFKLLYPCNSAQEMRDALPECLISIIPGSELAGLPRTAEAAYTIDGDQRALKQYDKMLPKIELYTATKLIF